jgi:hypothetical protein
MKDADLLDAYHTVMVETRHVLALYQRMRIILNAAEVDLGKLELAVHRVQDLEREGPGNRVGEPT